MFFVTPKPSVVELMIVCLQKAREAVFHIKFCSGAYDCLLTESKRGRLPYQDNV